MRARLSATRGLAFYVEPMHHSEFAVSDAKALKQAIERSATALNKGRSKSRRYPQRNVPRMQYYETDDDAVEDDDVSFRKFAVTICIDLINIVICVKINGTIRVIVHTNERYTESSNVSLYPILR